MTHSISFSDSTNPAKPPIVVSDSALNNQTSLSFVGANYSGYGPVIATDFLHLLENFANSSAPINPVQGQLWYDTSIGANILRVYNGTQWVEAGALKKASASNQPSVSASVAGDLWVDTTNSQLYLFSGAQWLLVGPTFSSGLQTGPIIESIVDTNNVSHSVISMYVASSTNATSYRISIISKDSFTPKVTITGFQTINEGINLSSVDSVLSSDNTVPTRFWGTATSADALLVNGSTVSANNFLRGDVASTSTSALNIRNAAGLSIGTDLSFNIAQGTTAYTIFSKSSTQSIEFNVNNNTLVHLDATTGNIGLGKNNTNPTTVLSVAGVITSGISGAPGGLIITDGTNPNPVSVLNITPTGGITTTLDTVSTGSLTIGGTITVGSGTSGGSVILPAGNGTTPPLFDIGSEQNPFRNVYANTFSGAFNGSFNGTITGDATGSAASLKNPTVFSITGDMITTASVNFTGNSGPATLNVTATSSLITGPLDTNGTPTRTAATAASAADQLLVLQTQGTTSNLVRMTRQTFLSGVGLYSIPVGTIMPFAGAATAVPTGWLLCDGSEVSTATYNQLFLVIGNIYTVGTLKGNNTFALPDMRGRMPLGLTNMNNYGNIANFVQATDSAGHTVFTGGQSGTSNTITLAANQTLAQTLGATGGTDAQVLNVNQIPQHYHSLNDGTAQYYAPGLNGGITDSNNTAQGYSISNTGTGYGLRQTAGMTTGATGDNVNVINPFMALNYIIFTGQGLS